jgi:hypothetical protein
MEQAQHTPLTAETIPLEIVTDSRDDDSPVPVKRAGRNRKLTPALFEKIMAAIEEAARITPACLEYGISPKTVFMRVHRDQEAAQRFAQAKQLRLARWHEEWLGEMVEHAKRSPWATAWQLEHNFPECYLNRPFVRTVNSAEAPIGDQVPEARLLEYSRQMAEFARANEPRTEARPLGALKRCDKSRALVVSWLDY